MTRREIDVILVTIGNTNGKKQVLEMVSYARVVATGKPLSILPFRFYSSLQTKPFLRKSYN